MTFEQRLEMIEEKWNHGTLWIEDLRGLFALVRSMQTVIEEKTLEKVTHIALEIYEEALGELAKH